VLSRGRQTTRNKVSPILKMSNHPLVLKHMYSQGGLAYTMTANNYHGLLLKQRLDEILNGWWASSFQVPCSQKQRMI
jgi:hypothetical protein